MSIEVRVAGPGDAAALAELHYLSHTVSFVPFVPSEWVRSRDLKDYLKRWQDFLDPAGCDTGSCAWIATERNAAVGMVQVKRQSDHRAQLNSMHVHPDHHRRGIGSLLMDAAVAFMRDAGYREATLGVDQENITARAFYERFGWEVAELLPTGVEGVPVAVYRLRL